MTPFWSTTTDDDSLSKSADGGEDRSITEDDEPASRSINEGEEVYTTEDVDWASWASNGDEDEGVDEGTWGDCEPGRACIHTTPLTFFMSTSYSLSVQDVMMLLQLHVKYVHMPC